MSILSYLLNENAAEIFCIEEERQNSLNILLRTLLIPWLFIESPLCIP